MAQQKSKRKTTTNRKKKEIDTTEKSNKMDVLRNKKTLYYSEFCLTDDEEFALFYIERKFFIDNNLKLVLNKFTLSESDLQINIDKKNKIELVEGLLKYKFGNYGSAKKQIVDMFYYFSEQAVFYKIKEFFGRKVNDLFIVLSEEHGKPLGLIKTTKRSR